MPLCPFCVKEVTDLKTLGLHLKIYHKDHVKDLFKCKEKNCFRTFAGWKEFRRHFSRSHDSKLALVSSTDVSAHGTCRNFPGVESEALEKPCSANLEGSDLIQPPEENLQEKVQLSALSLVAKLYANAKLPRNHVQEVVNDFGELLGTIFSSVQAIICNKNNGGSELDSNFDEIFDAVLKPFRSTLSSEYRRLAALQKTRCFIKGRDYVVGDRLDNILVEGRIVQDRTAVKVKFVPIRETLQHFLSLPNVLQQILDYLDFLEIQESHGVISNFVQGKLWKQKLTEISHETDIHRKIVLPLLIYYDDFEVNNPLGSHAGINKLGGVYFSLLCLPPEFRAEVQNIFLAILFHSSDRKTSYDGNDAIFGILVEELNFLLRDGIEVILKGESVRVFFAVGLVGGDNEGLNSALGFVEGYCDVMHDLQEGVLRYDLGHILYNLVCEKQILKLEDFNEKLKSFNYTINGFRNKPPLLSNDDIRKKKISMSASELFTLTLILPNLIIDVCPLDPSDKIWEFYIVLREILDICFAKSIQVEAIDVLDSLVSQHHTLYIDLFKDTLKPKHHNMNHYAKVMRMSGPLANLSVMRFESKHEELKSTALSTSSILNIIHTIVVKEQLRVCSRFLSGKGLSRSVEFVEGECVECISMSDDFYKFEHCFQPSEYRSPCVDVPFVNVNEIVYRLGSVVVFDIKSNTFPEFGKIFKIFVKEDERVLFVCQMFETEYYSETMHAFQVAETVDFQGCVVEDLVRPHLAILHTATCGTTYVSLRYAI